MQVEAERVSSFGPDSWCGKMSQEPLAQTRETTSGPSSKRQSESRSRTRPTFHYLRKGSGRWLTAGMGMDGPSPTEFSTHSFGECPSAAVVSRLSQILEDTPHQKYYLSAKACAGILRRAERRGKETAAGTGDGAYPAVARSLTARHDGSPCVDRGPNIVVAGFKPHAGVSAGSIGYQEETAPTIDTGKPMAVCDARGNGDGKTVCTRTGDHQSRVTDYTAIVMRQHNFGEYREGVGTPTAHNGTRHASEALVVDRNVRRLTPLECERLQGYPDGWTDIGPWTDSAGKLHGESSDSARYTALGNSIALPPWKWVLKRLCACYERDATMASLFDGIGGFPLIWERLNGPGSCLWASEIEEFPIAVTKYHFGG